MRSLQSLSTLSWVYTLNACCLRLQDLPRPCLASRHLRQMQQEVLRASGCMETLAVRKRI